MSAPLLSPEAISTLRWLRKGIRPPIRTYFLLTSGGIVIRELPLRFTSPSAMGLVRTEIQGTPYRPRIFDPFTGEELARVRLWVEPRDIPYISAYLSPYRRPRVKFALFPIEPKEYERARPRARAFFVTKLQDLETMTDEEIDQWYEEIISRVNGSPYALVVGRLDPGRFEGLLDIPDSVLVADYPERPRTAYDLEHMQAYGLETDRDRFDPMQFNQTARIVLGVIVSLNPDKFTSQRVPVALTEEEEAVLSERAVAP
jgi:hypothetical protein